MSITGWYARRFGLSGFKAHRLSKLSAITTLIFGTIFIVFVPILFANIMGIEDTYLAIRNLIILFLPAVVSAIAILSTKTNITVGTE